ncbi:hypothetical protein BABINDRAFT_38670 [Babjeviella inositovora NRRL Y-12698]|uniref:Carbohydrate kinase FGGY C-terminal domain-containing protein n=1 Tax=Babjeviella inositovora NRRL Y-12698 TaxID=984486 RepID=A0A1E3QMW3_9ASCO|nr:uncharacterized protein BABINDRAFT_38670 [Babjeviella inositovora NRRL Y-12698]ODQ78804.1 hypothetical protein BABINDRAFT_38670 [Babjeviella inositovora NRRL Y-12698]
MSSTNPSGLSLGNPGTGPFYVGVDVGTGSARAAVVDPAGAILGLAEKPISRHELRANHITQSTTEIWDAICFCVRLAVVQANVDPVYVHGIGFDATCSLVAIDHDDMPVAVGPDFSDAAQNVILWMDHRAHKETDTINATGDVCLKYVGGSMSIEMEMPKIMWLQANVAPNVFAQMKFYDLPDFLTHRATGSEARSYCSAVCKQGFVPPGVDGSKHGWSQEFLEAIGLGELVANGFAQLGGSPGLGGTYLHAGETVGTLSEAAAAELGLSPGCRVGSGVIDAYAGWIGTVAASDDTSSVVNGATSGIAQSCGRLAAVAGTLTCHIAMSASPLFVPGVWGPYRDVIAPGFWLAEGGQSCTGALLAHVLATHPAYAELTTAADISNISKFDFLNNRLEDMTKATGTRSVVALAKHLFFYGDYHGNRSPVADARMRAAIVGQSMDVSLDDLALTYFGACEFIAQQTRQIVAAMTAAGHAISRIYMSGGQCRNGLLMRLLADCTGLPIVIPRYIDAAVVFGAALLGAVAAQGVRTELKGVSATHDVAKSPYTAPSATASSTALASLAPQSVGYPFPLTRTTEAEDDFEDEGLSFGAKRLAAASGDALWLVMEKMSGAGKVVAPNTADDPDRRLLDAKYKVFLDLCVKQQEYRAAIDAVEALA